MKVAKVTIWLLIGAGFVLSVARAIIERNPLLFNPWIISTGVMAWAWFDTTKERDALLNACNRVLATIEAKKKEAPNA